MKSIFLALISGCAVLISLPALIAEAGAVFGAGHSQSTRIAAMAKGRPDIGLSVDSYRRVLRQCHAVMDDSGFGAEPEASRAAVLQHCEGQIDRALRISPADGYLWMERGRLHLAQGDIQQMLVDVARSRALAPNEMWLAVLRNDLVANFEPAMTAEEYRGQSADFLVMAQGPTGARLLAARYLDDPAFRERITSLIEALPNEAQQRFLANIRRVARDRRSVQQEGAQ